MRKRFKLPNALDLFLWILALPSVLYPLPLLLCPAGIASIPNLSPFAEPGEIHGRKRGFLLALRAVCKLE